MAEGVETIVPPLLELEELVAGVMVLAVLPDQLVQLILAVVAVVEHTQAAFWQEALAVPA